jgi:hypothetical protein
MEKIEKELENPEKRKRESSLVSPLSPARPHARVPAPPDRRTLPVSGSSPSRVPSLSRSLPSGIDLSAPVSFACALPFSLCLAGPDRQSPNRCLERPFLLSLRRGPYLSVLPSPRSPWTGACTLAHVAGFLGHDARPRA